MAYFAVLCLLLLSSALCTSAESFLEIKTSPSGPAFMAASWIRLACKYQQDSNNTIKRYNWRVSCRRTGETIYTIRTPIMDTEGWATIWVHSTPLHCLDAYQCSVYRSEDVREGQEIASRDFMIDKVTGVGMSLYQGIFQGTVPNNSIVVVQQHEGVPQEVLCQSGLLKTSMNRFTNCSAKWLSPTSSAVGKCARSLHDVENEMERVSEGTSNNVSEMETVFNSVRVDFDSADFEEGVYSCKIQDENLEENQLFVGVYRSVPELIVDSSYEVAPEGYIMHCDIRGIPPTAVLWYKDETLISNISDHGSSSSSQQITKADGSIVYRHSFTASTVGIYSCDARSTWVTADHSTSGRISGSAFFVVHPSSSRVNLECAFPEGSTSRVEWVDDSSAPLYFEHLEPPAKNLKDNTAIASLFLTQDTDNQVLTCKGVDQSGHAQYKKYTIIIDTSFLEVATLQNVVEQGGKESEEGTADNNESIEDLGGYSSKLLIGTIVLAGLVIITIILIAISVTVSCMLKKKKKLATSKHPSTLTLENKDSKETNNKA